MSNIFRLCYTVSMLKTVRYWLPFAFVITVLCGLILATSQQIYRQSANDPQIQFSEDIASRLSQGEPTDSYATSSPIDIGKSLAPFMIIYNEKGQPVVSQVILDGKTPTIPPGVLDVARQRTEYKVTWQPKPGVRIASVITHYGLGQQAGFVLVGRSLREVENRVIQLEMKLFIGWLITLGGSFIAISLVYPKK